MKPAVIYKNEVTHFEFPESTILSMAALCKTYCITSISSCECINNDFLHTELKQWAAGDITYDIWMLISVCNAIRTMDEEKHRNPEKKNTNL